MTFRKEFGQLYFWTMKYVCPLTQEFHFWKFIYVMYKFFIVTQLIVGES